MRFSQFRGDLLIYPSDVYKIFPEHLKKGEHLEELNVDGWIMFKRALNTVWCIRLFCLAQGYRTVVGCLKMKFELGLREGGNCIEYLGDLQLVNKCSGQWSQSYLPLSPDSCLSS